MKRREFITLLGGAAAAWPTASRAQQLALPVIGWLGAGSLDMAYADPVAAFRKGVEESGFVEGKTVIIEYRWAEGRYDQLPALAAELARRPVAAILASGGVLPTRAAMAATSTIPIVFVHAGDPVAAGLVASLKRPGGNVTGVNFFGIETGAKQLGLLRTLVPTATKIGFFMNPLQDNPDFLKDVEMGARSLGLMLQVLKVSTEREINEAFKGFAQQRPDGLLIQVEPFLAGRYDQIASLATRAMIPSIAGSRVFAKLGGLMSYGASASEAYHQTGVYLGRILKGEKPADLPVVQSTRFDLVINLKTAKALAITVPPNVLAIADEVME